MPLHSVGWALARISLMRGSRPGPSEAGGDSRAAVLQFIEAADDAVRVEQIAEAVGLHANTIRGHLDALLASGRITRVADQRPTRGRPHWLYSTTASASIRQLAQALDAELERASAPDAARVVAATWAEVGPDVRPAGTIEEAVNLATQALTDFGFGAVRNPVGDQITLSECPYASLVHEYPVICDIHAELLGEVLARTGQPVTLARLAVFPRPGLCVAHLERSDAKPEWSVEMATPRASARPRSSPVPPTPSPRKKK